jgi:hypothetical protein
MRNTATNGSHQQRTRPGVGVKELAHTLGRTPYGVRSILRRNFGRHQSFEIWRISEEDAAYIIKRYKKKRVTNGRASST